MFRRKFKLHPQYFLYMVLLGLGGMFFMHRWSTLENSEVLLIGAVLLLTALIFLLLQFAPIPTVGARVVAEIEKTFPAEKREKVINLLTDGFTGFQADGIHLKMLKFAQGDLDRLKKLSRALHHQTDFRDAHEILEHTNAELSKK